jgi:hypothetical protein
MVGWLDGWIAGLLDGWMVANYRGKNHKRQVIDFPFLCWQL